MSLYAEWMYNNLRHWDSRFTPVTDEVVDLFNRVNEEAGGVWAHLAREIGIRERHLRRIRNKKTKVVTLTLMDRLLCRSQYSHYIHELPWYTIEELVELGIWSPPYRQFRSHDAVIPELRDVD